MTDEELAQEEAEIAELVDNAVKKAVAAEREECARIADEAAVDSMLDSIEQEMAMSIAEQIRKRGQS